jgi:hypothetical protein
LKKFEEVEWSLDGWHWWVNFKDWYYDLIDYNFPLGGPGITAEIKKVRSMNLIGIYFIDPLQ